MTFATISGPEGPILLTFGPRAIESYCAFMRCKPTIESVLANFKDGQQMEAMCEIVRIGYELSLYEAGTPVTVSDYEACRLIETATAEEGDSVTKAFFSAILNQDYDQWLKEQQQLAIAHNDFSKEADNPKFFGLFSYN